MSSGEIGKIVSFKNEMELDIPDFVTPVKTGLIIRRPASPVPPTGFIRLDGSVVQASDHPELAAYLGNEVSGGGGGGSVVVDDVVTLDHDIYTTFGNGRPWDQQYDFNFDQTADLSSLTQAGNLPYPVAYSQVVVTKNKVYLLGGDLDGESTRDSLVCDVNANGSLGSWTVLTNFLPVETSYSRAVVTKNKVMLVGGYNNTGTLDIVQTATINSEGTISGWSVNTETLAIPVDSHSLVLTKNRLYILGGNSDAGAISDIQSCNVDYTGDLTGTWSVDGNLPGSLLYSNIVTTKNRVFTIGGTGTASSEVNTAPVNADGTLGSWGVIDYPLPVVSDSCQVFVTRNKVYLVGLPDAATQYDTEIYSSVIDSNGMLDPWVFNSSSNGYFSHSQLVAVKNKIYLIGGVVILGGENLDNGNTSKIMETTISGCITDYSKFYDGSVNKFNGEGLSVGNTITIPGSNSTVTVEYDPFSAIGSGRPWQQQYDFNVTESLSVTNFTSLGNVLPIPLDAAHAVLTKNRVYLLGGYTTGTPVSSVYTAPITDDGVIGDWSAANDAFPLTMGYSSPIVIKNRVYLLGGTPSYSVYSSDIYTAAIDSNGFIGSWSTVPNALPFGVFASQAFVTKTRVYLIGGQAETAYSSAVCSAPVDTDGVIGAWVIESNALPVPLFRSHIAVTKNRVYMLGGDTDVDRTADMYTAVINSNGEIGPWVTVLDALPAKISDSQVVVSRNRIYLLGGRGEISRTADVFTAPINADGIIGTWTTIQNVLPVPLEHSQVVVTKSGIYLLGGYRNNGGLTREIFTSAFLGGRDDYSPFYDGTYNKFSEGNLYKNSVVSFSSDTYATMVNDSYSSIGNGRPWEQQHDLNEVHTGNITGWSAKSDTVYGVSNAAVVATKSYIYVLGGRSGSSVYTNSIQRAKIKPDGTLGTWEQLGNTLAFACGHSSFFVTKNKVFILGGYSQFTNTMNHVQTATINADGTLGTWSSYGTLPYPVYRAATVVTKNRVYLIGGQYDASVRDTIYMAPIDSNGDIGAWVNSGLKLPSAYGNIGIAVTKNRVYMLGGHTWSSPINNIVTAVINSDGTLGAITPAGTLPVAMASCNVYCTRNRVYIINGYINGVASSAIYSAPINSDGTLGSWSLTNNLPGILQSSALVVTKNHIYLISGHSGSSIPKTVYGASLNGVTNDYSSFYDGSFNSYISGDIPNGTILPIKYGTEVTFEYDPYTTIGSGKPWKEQYDLNISQTQDISEWSTYDSLSIPSRTLGYFTWLTQTSRAWTGMAVSGSDVYACVHGGDIYKQTGGTGDFLALGQTSRQWRFMTVLNGNVYATARGIGIYMQEGGVGNFVSLGQTARVWQGMTTLGNDVYACDYGGDIYKQTNGIDNFESLNQEVRQWHGMATLGSDVYCCVWYGEIYKQTGGVGDFVMVDSNVRAWAGMAALGPDMYASEFGGDIYKQTNGVGEFVATGQTLSSWFGMVAVGLNMYAVIQSEGIYKADSVDDSSPFNVRAGQAVVVKDYVYILGGRDENLNYINSVKRAMVLGNGTLGQWESYTSLPAPVAYSQALVTKNKLFLIGGDNGTNFLNSVLTATINTDGSLGQWSYTGVQFPDGISYSVAFMTKNKLYVLGAHVSPQHGTTMYVSDVDTSGNITGFNPAGSHPLSNTHSRSQSVVTKNRVYLLGGHIGDNDSSDIYYADIRSNGTIGSWVAAGNLPASLESSQSFVTRNRVYLFGGRSMGSTVSTVYTAPIDANGVIGAWTTGPSLPAAVCESHLVSTVNKLYLLGGNSNGAVSTVYKANLIDGLNNHEPLYDGTYNVFNVNDVLTGDTFTGEGTSEITLTYDPYTTIGSGKPWKEQYDFNTTLLNPITGWQQTGNIPEALDRSQVVVTNNRVYLLGGFNGTDSVASVYTCPINPDGTLGTWVAGTPLPRTLSHSQAVVLRNTVYLLGGFSDLQRISDVYKATINPDGTLGAWTSDAPIFGSNAFSQAFVTKNRIYLLGGVANNGATGNNATSLVYTSAINPDGTLAGWENGPSLPSVVSISQSICTRNRVYLIGGYNESTHTSLVYTATIGSDGILSEFQATTPLPNAVQAHQCIVTRNRAYLFGGYSGWFTSQAYSAAVNPDGTLGTWQVNESLDASVSFSQVAITKNHVHLIGGYVNGAWSTSVRSATIDGGLNDYTPFYDGSINKFVSENLPAGTVITLPCTESVASSGEFSLPDWRPFDSKLDQDVYSYIKT